MPAKRRQGSTQASHWACAAAARGRRVRNDRLTAWTSCARDEGGPLGIGFQERVPIQSKRQRSKDAVVSVGSKSEVRFGQVSIRETNESEPPTTRPDAALRDRRIGTCELSARLFSRLPLRCICEGHDESEICRAFDLPDRRNVSSPATQPPTTLSTSPAIWSPPAPIGSCAARPLMPGTPPWPLHPDA
jgi:hypothetical protein